MATSTQPKTTQRAALDTYNPDELPDYDVFAAVDEFTTDTLDALTEDA